MPDKQDWAKEPWEFIAAGEDEPYSKIVAADGKCIACDMDYYPFIETECMPRIAACVSACAGVPTEDLEQVIALGKAQYNVMQALESRYPTMSQKEFEEMVERGEAEEGKIYAVKKEAPDDRRPLNSN